VKADSFDNREVVRRFNGIGTIKLLITAGFFIENDQSRIDLLIVGDQLKVTSLKTAIRTLEADTGRDLRYAVFETKDFLYRLGLYDKFIRDILDYPNRKIIDRIGI